MSDAPIIPQLNPRPEDDANFWLGKLIEPFAAREFAMKGSKADRANAPTKAQVYNRVVEILKAHGRYFEHRDQEHARMMLGFKKS